MRVWFDTLKKKYLSFLVVFFFVLEGSQKEIDSDARREKGYVRRSKSAKKIKKRTKKKKGGGESVGELYR